MVGMMLCRWKNCSPIYRGSGQCCCLSHPCHSLHAKCPYLKELNESWSTHRSKCYSYTNPDIIFRGTCKTVDLGWFWPLFYIPRRDHRRLDWTLAKFSSVGIVGFVRLFGNFQRSKGIMDRFPEGDLPSNWPGARWGSQVSSRLNMNSECIDHIWLIH